jgi:sugar O-acyltransferase (sialic acid O-acetyltransferase NeuD family)
VLGCSSLYVWNIIDLVQSLGHELSLVANKDVPVELGLDSYLKLEELDESFKKTLFVTGVVKPESKRFVVGQGKDFGLHFAPPLISPRAYVGTGVALGQGAIIRSLALVDSRAQIGEHTTLSPLVSVGHHTSVGAFCHIANGASVSGNVVIGDDVFVGSGAVIRDGLTIGSNSVIGMGAVVVKDVPNNSVIMGNPGRIRSK